MRAVISTLLVTLAICITASGACAEPATTVPTAAATVSETSTAVPTAVSQRPLLTGQRDFDPLSAYDRDSALAMLLGKKPLSPSQVVESEPDDPQLKDVWTGNRPRFKTSARHAELHLVRGEKAFDVTLDLNDDAIVMKSSAPRFAQQAGGVRAALKNGKPRRVVLQGRDQSGVVVFIPEVPVTEESRGVLVCPRDFVGGDTRRDKISLLDSGYRLTEANFEVDGEAATQMRGSLETARARASIFTSPAVLPSDPYYDESVVREPRVRIVYTPAREHKNGIVTRVANTAEGAAIVGGIEVEADLHNSAGYRRITTQRDAIYVQEVFLKDAQPILFPLNEAAGTPLQLEIVERKIDVGPTSGFPTLVGPGPCYIVLRKVEEPRTRYLREDFSAKEDGGK